jgi:hypothetical protein
MRWDRLFTDLEAQLDAADAAEFAGEVVERTRIEVGALRLVDRLRAALDTTVRLTCLGSEQVAGRLRRVGPDWLLLAERPEREALVPLAAVTSVAGLGPWSSADAGGASGVVAGKLNLRYALRGVARDRAGVALTLWDGTALAGTVDRVGADFVEVAEHPAGELRRVRAVRQVRTVPLHALAVIRTSSI